MKKYFNIIYMGTPDFAVPALVALKEAGHRILLVITQPDRPSGRGRKQQAPPVKKAALDFGIPVFQPESIKAEAVVARLKELKPDFIVVTAFGRILPPELLGIPKYGAVNIHASLLPCYRGPAPIQWAIINGEKETGVTTMLMDSGLDTGDVLLFEKTEISEKDTSRTLNDRLADMGALLIIDTLEKIAEGHLRPKPQNHSNATYAPLLTKNDGHIDWKQPARKLDAFIRGMTPWPGAYTFDGENRLKIFSVKPICHHLTALPGTVLPGFSDELRIATGEGALVVLEIQGAAGKRLSITDFLRGHSIPPGTQFV
jgi:methionyl-tRNA formyltransferase